MNYIIRKASMDDVNDIARIHVNSWQEAYKGLMPQRFIESYTFDKRHKLWTNIIERELAAVFVAVSHDECLGFLCVGQLKSMEDTQTYELSSIYINSSYIGVGIGQSLYKECEKYLLVRGAEQVTVWALDSNKRALNFYAKLGFRLTGHTSKEQAEEVVLNDVELSKTLSADNEKVLLKSNKHESLNNVFKAKAQILLQIIFGYFWLTENGDYKDKVVLIVSKR